MRSVPSTNAYLDRTDYISFASLHRQMFDLIESYLRHKSDMVNYEAARAICEMRGVSGQELTKPIAGRPAFCRRHPLACLTCCGLLVLQLFLSSPKSSLKFAAIRTLAKLAQTQPQAVSACNLDMEKLINDENRSVATYAITTLLKVSIVFTPQIKGRNTDNYTRQTGNEASVDRLMKQISAFMSEISDEFKIIVVNAIRSLCLKFPAKQSVMLTFLSGVLRDEGGYDFKKSVVEAIFDMVKYISDSKEAGE